MLRMTKEWHPKSKPDLFCMLGMVLGSFWSPPTNPECCAHWPQPHDMLQEEVLDTGSGHHFRERGQRTSWETPIKDIISLASRSSCKKKKEKKKGHKRYSFIESSPLKEKQKVPPGSLVLFTQKVSARLSVFKGRSWYASFHLRQHSVVIMDAGCETEALASVHLLLFPAEGASGGPGLLPNHKCNVQLDYLQLLQLLAAQPSG